MLAPGAPTVPKLVPTQGFTNTSIAPNTVSTRGFTGNCQPPSRHRTGQIGPPASMHANAGVPRPDQGTGQGGIPHMVPKAISVSKYLLTRARSYESSCFRLLFHSFTKPNRQATTGQSAKAFKTIYAQTAHPFSRPPRSTSMGTRQEMAIFRTTVSSMRNRLRCSIMPVSGLVLHLEVPKLFPF